MMLRATLDRRRLEVSCERYSDMNLGCPAMICESAGHCFHYCFQYAVATCATESCKMASQRVHNLKSAPCRLPV